jgi:hypothetical protein
MHAFAAQGASRGLRTLFLGRPIIEPVAPAPPRLFMAGKPLRLRYGPIPHRLARASLVGVPERGRAGHRPQ